jgi:hypothetical protein
MKKISIKLVASLSVVLLVALTGSTVPKQEKTTLEGVNGPTAVYSGSVHEYCVSQYFWEQNCTTWDVGNGTILSQYGRCVTIQWGEVSSGSIEIFGCYYQGIDLAITISPGGLTGVCSGSCARITNATGISKTACYVMHLSNNSTLTGTVTVGANSYEDVCCYPHTATSISVSEC